MENQELINRRKKEAKKLQDLIIEKLRTVQMLVIERILINDDVNFELIGSIEGKIKWAYLRLPNESNFDAERNRVILKHYEFHSYLNDAIEVFYKEQLDTIDYWISVL